MDGPTESNETEIRCRACFKLLCKQSNDGVLEVRFQRLIVEVKGDPQRIDCPRCGTTNAPPFYTKAVTPVPAPPAGTWPVKPVLPPLKPR